MRFFEEQSSTPEGLIAVKLEKVIIAIVAINVIAKILDIAYAADSASGFGFIIVGFIGLCLMFTGFYGAYKLNRTLLLVYMIIIGIAIGLECLIFIFDFIAIGALAGCSSSSDCYIPEGVNVSSLMVILIFGMIFQFIYFILQVWSFILSSKLRNALHILSHHQHPPLVQSTQPYQAVPQQQPYQQPYPPQDPQQPGYGDPTQQPPSYGAPPQYY